MLLKDSLTDLSNCRSSGRIAHYHEMLIMVVFRIPLFQEIQLKTLWHQNCCCLPLNFLKDLPSNLNIPKLVSLGIYSTRTEIKHWWFKDRFTPYPSSTLKNIQCITNRISNRFNSVAADSELYGTCWQERFCENNEQLKEVINSIKDLHHSSLTWL